MDSITGTTRFVIPDVVATQFHIRPGDTVVDLGAGSGYFVPVLGKLVGEEGVVYALDVQKNLVEQVTLTARKHHLENVRALWADIDEPEGSTLESDVADVAIMVNTLFQLEDKPTALREAFRILRPGGKLCVIDWSESFGGLGPQPGDVCDEATAGQLGEEAGFSFERTFDAGGHHYGISLRKP